MTIPILIRDYKEDDRAQCRTLWRELTEWHREIFQDPTIGGERPEFHFDKHLAKVGSGKIWVAVSDSRVVGFVGLNFGDNEAEIEPLIVSRAYRGKGIGKRLVETVIFKARERNVKYLNVGPVARNVQAIKFLYKQGFRNLGHIQLFMCLSNTTWKKGPEIFGCKFNF